MLLYTLTTSSLVAALCLLCGAAAQAQGSNYVDDGSFEYAEQPRAPLRPAPAYRPTSGQAASSLKPTPVAILKQINRHNEDGSYTYGYEGADGAFKIETKLANGEFMGKYGYVDDAGKVRVVEYGANKYGFQPAGEGITVAPPTLVDETQNQAGKRPKGEGRVAPQTQQQQQESVEYDDGQYYEESTPVRAPAPVRSARPVSRPAPRPAPQPLYTPQAPQQTYSSFSSSQNFGQSRPVSAPSSLGPTPPRAAIPGAAPVGPSPSFSQGRAQSFPVARSLSRPPQQQQQQPSYFAPAPVYENPGPASAAAPSRPAPSRPSYGRSSGSILDQLERDYALPSNSAPALHDITFGSSF